MQPHSSPPPFRHRPPERPGADPPSGGIGNNEFADAVARMFERRKTIAGNPVVLPRLDADDAERQGSPLLGALFSGAALRRALAVVPLAVAGYAVVWFLQFEPQRPPSPVAVARVMPPPVAAAPAPPLPPPPERPDLVEAKTPLPAAAPPPETAAVQPPPPAEVDTRPLGRDEIRELQGKLSAAGFAAGPIDGVVGPQTQAALRRYAEARSLAKPGSDFREVLSRLRAESPPKP